MSERLAGNLVDAISGRDCRWSASDVRTVYDLNGSGGWRSCLLIISRLHNNMSHLLSRDKSLALGS
jgi:hypothetical protein